MKKYEVTGAMSLAKIVAMPRQNTYLLSTIKDTTGFSDTFWNGVCTSHWSSSEYKFINPSPTSANSRLFELVGRGAQRGLVVHWTRVDARWAAVKDQFKEHLLSIAKPTVVEVPLALLQRYATADGQTVEFSPDELKTLAAFAAT